jgi:hypothetical protein
MLPLPKRAGAVKTASEIPPAPQDAKAQIQKQLQTGIDQ